MARVCLDLSPLATSSRWRGHGGYALALARALTRAPRLLGSHELWFLTAEGWRLRAVPASERALEAASRPAAAALDDSLYYALKHGPGRAALALARIDLYHATDPKGTPRPPRCRVVATCHDMIPVILRYPFDPPLLPVAARAVVERLRYRRFDHVIAISEHTRRDLAAIVGLPATRVSVVLHGVDRERWSAAAARDERASLEQLVGERPYFLYVGGFDRRKQVPALVDAFARAAPAIDETLVVCGGLEPAVRAELEARAARASLAPARLALPGFVAPDRLAALYRHATAHVMLSSYEGFGMTLTEAFACGCPVLAQGASSIPEVAAGAALLVESAAPEQVAPALQRLARDGALRAELRARGLARAAELSWERCAELTAGVYSNVLAR